MIKKKLNYQILFKYLLKSYKQISAFVSPDTEMSCYTKTPTVNKSEKDEVNAPNESQVFENILDDLSGYAVAPSEQLLLKETKKHFDEGFYSLVRALDHLRLNTFSNVVTYFHDRVVYHMFTCEMYNSLASFSNTDQEILYRLKETPHFGKSRPSVPEGYSTSPNYLVERNFYSDIPEDYPYVYNSSKLTQMGYLREFDGISIIVPCGPRWREVIEEKQYVIYTFHDIGGVNPLYQFTYYFTGEKRGTWVCVGI